MNTKHLVLALTGLMLLSIPLTLFLNRNKQELRSRANASTTLSFTPASSIQNPISKNVGDAIPLDLIVDPGNNMVTFIKFQVKFDPSKLAVDTTSFSPNVNKFPSTIEGPVTGSDTLSVAVSIGGDPTKAIQEKATVGTLHFKALSPTSDTPTQITFTSVSQVLSSSPSDQASENVLSTTTPAHIKIAGNTTITTAPTPTTIPTVSLTPGPTGISTRLKFDILLHGIGSSGDNPNPSGSSLSNKDPLHPQRDFLVDITDSNNQPVINTVASTISYNKTSGSFTGEIDLGPSFPQGTYSIKIKSERYLRKLIAGIITIKSLQTNSAPKTALVAGDIKDDNTLNVLDYNILLDCGYGSLNPLPLADPNSIYNSSFCKSHNNFRQYTDLNDNGIVDSRDYNLFLRELSVQNGD